MRWVCGGVGGKGCWLGGRGVVVLQASSWLQPFVGAQGNGGFLVK